MKGKHRRVKFKDMWLLNSDNVPDRDYEIKINRGDGGYHPKMILTMNRVIFRIKRGIDMIEIREDVTIIILKGKRVISKIENLWKNNYFIIPIGKYGIRIYDYKGKNIHECYISETHIFISRKKIDSQFEGIKLFSKPGCFGKSPVPVGVLNGKLYYVGGYISSKRIPFFDRLLSEKYVDKIWILSPRSVITVSYGYYLTDSFIRRYENQKLVYDRYVNCTKGSIFLDFYKDIPHIIWRYTTMKDGMFCKQKLSSWEEEKNDIQHIMNPYKKEPFLCYDTFTLLLCINRMGYGNNDTTRMIMMYISYL